MAIVSTIEFLERRRSVLAKNLRDPGPSPEQITKLLTIAARVPDHGKLAPWRFILFEGEARTGAGRKLADIWQKNEPDARESRLEMERTRFERAPLVICVVSRAAPHPKIPEWEQVLSAGAVCQMLLSAALAMGYGAQWLSEWCCYDEAARTTLGLEPRERIAGLIYVGTTDETPSERPRPDMDEIVSHWRDEET